MLQDVTVEQHKHCGSQRIPC